MKTVLPSRLALAAAYTTLMTLLLACNTVQKNAAGSGGSVIASVPGISDSLRKSAKLTFRLLCATDAKAIANATALESADDPTSAAATVTFKQAGAVKIGDSCVLKVVSKEAAVIADARYQWRSTPVEKGLFYASAVGKVDSRRGLGLTVYTLFNDTQASAFDATFDVTLPAGQALDNLKDNGGSLICDGAAVITSTSVKRKADQLVTYKFHLPEESFAAARSCALQATTAGGDFAATGIQVSKAQATYGGIVLAPAKTRDTGLLVITATPAPCAGTYNTTTFGCTAGSDGGTADVGDPSTNTSSLSLDPAQLSTTWYSRKCSSDASGAYKTSRQFIPDNMTMIEKRLSYPNSDCTGQFTETVSANYTYATMPAGNSGFMVLSLGGASNLYLPWKIIGTDLQFGSAVSERGAVADTWANNPVVFSKYNN